MPVGDMPDGREPRPLELLHVEARGDREAVDAVDGELDVSET
jgi:hypothetical protein